MPSEKMMDDHRYIMLNGVGASYDFMPESSHTLRVWYIGSGAGTGEATVQITAL
jgi:hypothetical protein